MCSGPSNGLAESWAGSIWGAVGRKERGLVCGWRVHQDKSSDLAFRPVPFDPNGLQVVAT